MATMTAQMLVGKSHMYDGGINPTHYLFLSENSRRAWILVPQNIFSPVLEEKIAKVVWIPTLENMLEDGLLMVGLYVLQDKEVQNAAKQMFDWNKEEAYFEVYSINQVDREKLYALCRGLKHRYKTIISVFEGSTISRQMNVLLEYLMEVEVCKTDYARKFNVWTNTMNSNEKTNELKGGHIDETGK
jgi:predicted nucleic-acid-binding protein